MQFYFIVIVILLHSIDFFKLVHIDKTCSYVFYDFIYFLEWFGLWPSL